MNQKQFMKQLRKDFKEAQEHGNEACLRYVEEMGNDLFISIKMVNIAVAMMRMADPKIKHLDIVKALEEAALE